MEQHILTKNGVLHAQVCSIGTIEEALDWVRTTNPAGTSHNWQISERPEAAPITCASHPERTHYLFVC